MFKICLYRHFTSLCNLKLYKVVKNIYYKQFFTTSFEKRHGIEKNCLFDPRISIRVKK